MQKRPLLCLLVFLLCCGREIFATDAVNFYPGEVRSFQAVIDSIDPVRHSITVRHKPTGFTAEVFWDEASEIKATLQYDFDDVEEGGVQCWSGEIDSGKLEIEASDHLRPLSREPNNDVDPEPKQIYEARLVRKPVDSEELRNRQLRMRDGRKAYWLEAGGKSWKLLEKKHRPELMRPVEVEIGGLAIGTDCKNLVYREEPGRNVLVKIEPIINHRFVPPVPGGTSGMTAERYEKEMEKVRGSFAKFEPEIRKQAPVQMRVVPGLSQVGEEVSVEFSVLADHEPARELRLYTDYLANSNAPPKTLNLIWKKEGEARYVAVEKLRGLPRGQHRVHWICDVGGDVGEYWRSFAVADNDTLVVGLHFTGGRPNDEFEKYFLPYDYWCQDIVADFISGPMGERAPIRSAASFTKLSREHRRRGAEPNFMIIQGNYAGRSGWPAPWPVQFRAEPAALQSAVYRSVLELAEMCGFDPQSGSLQCYELGTDSINRAVEAGFRLFGSLCIHQNWQDSSWEINHTARPLRPYFHALNDFRKPGAGGPDAAVMVSQHCKSLLWTEYGLGVFEPCWLEQAWVGGGAGGRKTYDRVFMSRDFDLFESAVQNRLNQDVPLFLDVGIEFSNNDPSHISTRSNALMLEYMAQRAAKDPIVFCDQRMAAEYCRNHYKEIPQTVVYDPDFWCGTKAQDSIVSSWKPVDYPDLMQIENAAFNAYFKRPGLLPAYHWDYSKPWSYPDFGNKQLPRSVMGFLVPGEHDKFAVTPQITDTRAIEVKREDDGNGIAIRLTTPVALKNFPLALWDIPHEWKPGGGWWTVDGDAKFTPVRAPFTGNLNGILAVDAQPGENIYHLRMATPPRNLEIQDVVLDGVHGKVFDRDGTSMAYLWPTHPWDARIAIEVPAGREARLYAAPAGEEVLLHPGINPIVVPKEFWIRIVGLSREELVRGVHGE